MGIYIALVLQSNIVVIASRRLFKIEQYHDGLFLLAIQSCHHLSNIEKIDGFVNGCDHVRIHFVLDKSGEAVSG